MEAVGEVVVGEVAWSLEMEASWVDEAWEWVGEVTTFAMTFFMADMRKRQSMVSNSEMDG